MAIRRGVGKRKLEHPHPSRRFATIHSSGAASEAGSAPHLPAGIFSPYNGEKTATPRCDRCSTGWCPTRHRAPSPCPIWHARRSCRSWRRTPPAGRGFRPGDVDSTVASRAPIDPVMIWNSRSAMPTCEPISRSHFFNRSSTVCLCPNLASICHLALNIGPPSTRPRPARRSAARSARSSAPASPRRTPWSRPDRRRPG